MPYKKIEVFIPKLNDIEAKYNSIIFLTCVFFFLYFINKCYYTSSSLFLDFYRIATFVYCFLVEKNSKQILRSMSCVNSIVRIEPNLYVSQTEQSKQLFKK